MGTGTIDGDNTPVQVDKTPIERDSSTGGVGTETMERPNSAGYGVFRFSNQEAMEEGNHQETSRFGKTEKKAKNPQNLIIEEKKSTTEGDQDISIKLKSDENLSQKSSNSKSPARVKRASKKVSSTDSLSYTQSVEISDPQQVSHKSRSAKRVKSGFSKEAKKQKGNKSNTGYGFPRETSEEGLNKVIEEPSKEKLGMFSHNFRPTKLRVRRRRT